MNLDSVPSGEPVTLDRPAIPSARARRLAEMGLRAGNTVTPLHRTAGGGRVVGVGAARVAVARAVLSRLALHGDGSDGRDPVDGQDGRGGANRPDGRAAQDIPGRDLPDGQDIPGRDLPAGQDVAAGQDVPGGRDLLDGRAGQDLPDGRAGQDLPDGRGGVAVAVAVPVLRPPGAAPRLPETVVPAPRGPETAAPGARTGGARPLPPTVRCCHGDGGGRAPGDAAIVALAGTPNVGKSTLFNALTGARRQVGNWPGTTVEVGQGAWKTGGDTLALVDLPGTYSLDPVSPDEELTRALLVDAPPAERPDLVVVAVNAADAARGLYLLAQVREHGLPAVVALTMSDVAERRGLSVDADALGQALGVPVVPLDPRRRRGVDALGPAVLRALRNPPPEPLRLTAPGSTAETRNTGGDDLLDEFEAAEARFAWVNTAVVVATRGSGEARRTWSDRLDRVVTSPVIGPLVFLAVMWAVFQLTTVGAAPLVDGLDRLFAGPVTDAAAAGLSRIGLDGTWVEGLLLDGLIAGVGMVLTFVPLMTLMFVLLALLEDSGYLARAAVVADRLMRAVGLPGRAFVPIVVGFGCNVPAVAATRVLPDARHRLLTALVVPFTSCSARLPVYVLVGAAIFGKDAGNVVFSMYVASVALVIVGGLLLRATLLRGVRQEPLVLDLPGYQLPMPRMLAQVTWSRLAAFLRTATGIIVLTVVGVWLLSAVPVRSGAGGFGDVPVEDSAFAAAASAAAPVFAPAGFGDWHTAGALVVGFVAKEAVVSSWAQTYAADQPEDLSAPSRLAEVVNADFDKSSGGHPRLAGFAFLLFVLGYAPCVATMTAQVREIGRRWTLIGVGMNLTVSWLVAVAVFQLGRLFL